MNGAGYRVVHSDFDLKNDKRSLVAKMDFLASNCRCSLIYTFICIHVIVFSAFFIITVIIICLFKSYNVPKRIHNL